MPGRISVACSSIPRAATGGVGPGPIELGGELLEPSLGQVGILDARAPRIR